MMICDNRSTKSCNEAWLETHIRKKKDEYDKTLSFISGFFFSLLKTKFKNEFRPNLEWWKRRKHGREEYDKTLSFILSVY